MDNILVGIIVLAAVIFSIKSFIRTYKGQGGCNCSPGCSCPSRDSQDSCGQNKTFNILK
jgi:hypothetical protein